MVEEEGVLEEEVSEEGVSLEDLQGEVAPGLSDSTERNFMYLLHQNHYSF